MSARLDHSLETPTNRQRPTGLFRTLFQNLNCLIHTAVGEKPSWALWDDSWHPGIAEIWYEREDWHECVEPPHPRFVIERRHGPDESWEERQSDAVRDVTNATEAVPVTFPPKL